MLIPYVFNLGHDSSRDLVRGVPVYSNATFPDVSDSLSRLAEFLNLFAVLDWSTRRVLAWPLSNTLTTDFCAETVDEAVGSYRVPEVFNTHQGLPLTDRDFVDLIREKQGIALSMDGKRPASSDSFATFSLGNKAYVDRPR